MGYIAQWMTNAQMEIAWGLRGIVMVPQATCVVSLYGAMNQLQLALPRIILTDRFAMMKNSVTAMILVSVEVARPTQATPALMTDCGVTELKVVMKSVRLAYQQETNALMMGYGAMEKKAASRPLNLVNR